MRIPVKHIITGSTIVYSIVVTKLAMDRKDKLDILEKKLVKSKKKCKKLKKELTKPPYKRTILPRYGKPVPKNRPKYPIGFC